MKNTKAQMSLGVIITGIIAIIVGICMVPVVSDIAGTITDTQNDLQKTESIALEQDTPKYLTQAPIVSLDTLYIRTARLLTAPDDYTLDLTTGAITSQNDAFDCLTNNTEVLGIDLQMTNTSQNIDGYLEGLDLKDVTCYPVLIMEGAELIDSDQYVMSDFNSTCQLRTTNESYVGHNWTIDYQIEQDCLARATYTYSVDNYSTTTHVIVGLITLFFVLAMLVLITKIFFK